MTLRANAKMLCLVGLVTSSVINVPGAEALKLQGWTSCLTRCLPFQRTTTRSSDNNQEHGQPEARTTNSDHGQQPKAGAAPPVGSGSQQPEAEASEIADLPPTVDAAAEEDKGIVWVGLDGLKSRPDLNGQTAIVTGELGTNGRLNVTLESGEVINVKRDINVTYLRIDELFERLKQNLLIPGDESVVNQMLKRKSLKYLHATYMMPRTQWRSELLEKILRVQKLTNLEMFQKGIDSVVRDIVKVLPCNNEGEKSISTLYAKLFVAIELIHYQQSNRHHEPNSTNQPEPAKPQPESGDDMFGAFVRVNGIVSKRELNGKVGQVVSKVNDSGRYKVQFFGGESMLFKADNLEAEKQYPSLTYRPGVIAKVFGIQREPALNGQYVELDTYDKEKGRWAVTLLKQEGEQRSLKVSNLLSTTYKEEDLVTFADEDVERLKLPSRYAVPLSFDHEHNLWEVVFNTGELKKLSADYFRRLHVQVRGLADKPELNNQEGVVVAWNADQNGWIVKMHENNQRIDVLVDNLQTFDNYGTRISDILDRAQKTIREKINQKNKYEEDIKKRAQADPSAFLSDLFGANFGNVRCTSARQVEDVPGYSPLSTVTIVNSTARLNGRRATYLGKKDGKFLAILNHGTPSEEEVYVDSISNLEFNRPENLQGVRSTRDFKTSPNATRGAQTSQSDTFSSSIPTTQPMPNSTRGAQASDKPTEAEWSYIWQNNR